MNQSDISDPKRVVSHSGLVAIATGIDLRELFLALWRGKLIIAACVVVAALTSILVSLSLSNQYKATVLLMPASSSGSSDLLQLASQFSGLAALTGLNNGFGTQDKSAAAIELIKSWSFQQAFIRDNHIEVEAFAVKEWERANNTLEIDPKIYDAAHKKWVRSFDPAKGETSEPNDWELFQTFSKRIDVSQDKATGLVTLSVEYYSPVLAKQWTDKLVIAVNRWFQEQDRLEARKSIEYLKQQISKTSLSEMQNTFYKLIEEQTKTLMLAEIKDEYIFKTLSPAQVPEERSKPKRILIASAATFLGGVLGCFVVLIRKAYKYRSDFEVIGS